MKSLCESISDSMSRYRVCDETGYGARVSTTCVSMSFDPIYVYVQQHEDGFVVHDANVTMKSILETGTPDSAAKRIILMECKRYGINFDGWRVSWKFDGLEWLDSAICAVAATVATAPRLAEKTPSKKPRNRLADELNQLLENKFAAGTISRGYRHFGESGRNYKFELAVKADDRLALIETVAPRANSVNSKYVAFADVPPDEGVLKIAAHNNDLAEADINLLENVAKVASPDSVENLVTEWQARFP